MSESTEPTPIEATPVEPVAPAATLPGDTGWRPLPRAARNVRVAVGALAGASLCVPPWLAGAFRLDVGFAWKLLWLVVAMLLCSSLFAWIAHRRWLSTAWRLDARGLQVRRGRMFHREVLVPRSRVQHLDLERGPIERRYGLATIVVHTAGSRLQALRQSGLADADAVALRDALVPDADVDDDAV